jgi:hypothetical protein
MITPKNSQEPKKKKYKPSNLRRLKNGEKVTPTYNHDKLRGKIYEKFKNINAWGEAIGLTRITAHKRLQGKHPFTQDEIFAMIQIFEIKPEEIMLYFFTPNAGIEPWWEKP